MLLYNLFKEDKITYIHWTYKLKFIVRLSIGLVDLSVEDREHPAQAKMFENEVSSQTQQELADSLGSTQ